MPSRPATPSLFQPETAPASKDWIRAHCDGGARGNPGPAGYGALIQGQNGTVLAELSEFLGIRTNNYAEYAGLLGCLQYALDHHHPRLRVVSDSELMVKQIQGKYKVNSPDLKPLWQEARNRIARLEAFEITHALRHKNKDADRLANEAMDRGMDRGMKRNPIASPSAPAPKKATPYPTRSEAPPNPYPKAETMLRGFTKDGVVHVLGGASLPDGIFVKIIRE
jgi:ribonuclease HI